MQSAERETLTNKDNGSDYMLDQENLRKTLFYEAEDEDATGEAIERRTRPRVRPSAHFDRTVKDSIDAARHTLLALQHPAGYWCFELEADCTIPAEYILMMHFMDDIDDALQANLAVYLREHQNPDGGWPLYLGGDFDLSGSVKAYYALKLAGDKPDAPHMRRARDLILAHGGAARCNVFTRITLAQFEQIPWRGVPFVPVEIMLLPRWFPFHINKVSYWSRTVMVPLSVLCSLKAKARNANLVNILELFTTPPDKERNYFSVRSPLNRALLWIEKIAKRLEPLIPRRMRHHAIGLAEKWVVERLNGVNGLGAIFPAMVNAHEMFAQLGYPADHPFRIATKTALEKLLVVRTDSAYCQPCVSPIWDTALAVLALQESGTRETVPAVARAVEWLEEQQLLDAPGDWREDRPHLRGGGWPFQFGNGHYPDLDDTAAVGWALRHARNDDNSIAIERAAEWLVGMQSRGGGFAAFDVDNTHYYLNEIPFADHGALLDPPTSDVTARCATFLALLDPERYRSAIDRCLRFLRLEQEDTGAWFGRWGTNYIYGTWSVLTALEAAGEAPDQPYVRRAVEWLKQVQRSDGGWGESNDSYGDKSRAGRAEHSTSFQTAWALLGLMAAGEADSPAVQRGVEFLLRTQRPDGLWHDPGFTAPGFPRVFYLKYHGYDKYFPLWALARYYKGRAGCYA